MKLSTLCHWLSQSRRCLLLAGALLIAILLAFVLPDTLWLILCIPVLAASALFLVWKVFGLGQFSAVYQRPPAPRDAQAETVLIDADLLDEGLGVQAVSQPIEPQPNLSLRMGSGALLLGTAMTLLSDEVSPTEQAAIHRAVTRLNIRPDRMKKHSPILLREKEEEYTAVTVQDGPGERSYFLAGAASLAHLCSAIWEDTEGRKGPRPLTADDRARILDAAAYLEQGGCRVLAYATAEGTERPTFLGLCGLGEHLRMDAVQELSVLKGMGLTVMLRDSESDAIDTAALRKALDLPDLHARADVYLSAGRDAPLPDTLTICPLPDMPLSEPIAHLRTLFARSEGILTAFTRVLGLALLCCLLAGGVLSGFAATAVMLCAAWFYGIPEDMKPLRWPVIALCAVGCLLLRVFLGATVPGAALGAGSIACVLLSMAATTLLQGRGRPRREQWLPILGLSAVLAILCGALGGATLLSALFACLWAGAIALLCHLVQ